VAGPLAEHVIAFAGSWKRQRLIIVVGRHFGPLTEGGRQWPAGWDGVIEHPAAAYEPLIGGDAGQHLDALSLAILFRDLPVSVLRRV
jgi:(1->4)-alpha-D-glucan 1-alpha-D-glucosylmutase